MVPTATMARMGIQRTWVGFMGTRAIIAAASSAGAGRNGVDTVTTGRRPVEADLAAQRREPPGLLEGVEPRVHLDGRQLEGAIATGLGQPAEPRVRLAQGELDRRELEGRHVAAPGQLAQLLQDPEGQLALAGQ